MVPIDLDKLSELIFVALGEASMCWSETPKGVFESEKAKEIGDKLVRDVWELLEGEGDG